jgi:hypothetical protein
MKYRSDLSPRRRHVPPRVVVEREEAVGKKTPFPDVSQLSLRARAAFGLTMFEGYCRARGLEHPQIGAFKDHLWRFVGTVDDGDAFDRWLEGEPPLVDAGQGYEYPAEFETFLAARGVPKREFRRALRGTTEVLYGSLYAAADDFGSRRNLQELWAVAEPLGVHCPEPGRFNGSRWADRGGWGVTPSPEMLAQWRRGEQG